MGRIFTDIYLLVHSFVYDCLRYKSETNDFMTLRSLNTREISWIRNTMVLRYRNWDSEILS